MSYYYSFQFVGILLATFVPHCELLRHVLFDKLASLAFLCDKESIETFVENFKGNPFNHHPKEIWFYNTC
jgi:hypothetical protein